MTDIPPDISAEPDVLPQEPEQDAPTVECNVATLQHQSGPQMPEIDTDVGTPPTVQQPHSPHAPQAHIHMPPGLRMDVAPFFVSYPPGYLTCIDMMTSSLKQNGVRVMFRVTVWYSAIYLLHSAFCILHIHS